MRKARYGLLLSCAVLGGTASSALADNTTLYVGADPHRCAQAQYPTINAAVAAAPPGATIRVCPGLYPEHVMLTKPITLLGTRNGNAGTAQTATATRDPQHDAIIVNAGQGAVDVYANHVTVSGFTIQGNGSAKSYPDAAIYVHPGSSRVISRDVVSGNGIGVYVDGSQDQLSITKDGFSGNTRGPANMSFIPAGGLFAAGDGPLINTTIGNNYFTRNGQFAMNVGEPSQGLVVDHNQAAVESTILVLGRATSPEVDFNRGTRVSGAAILLFGATHGAHVEHNVIRGTGPGNPNGSSGIRTYRDFGATTPNDRAVIAHNDISNFTLDGFGLGSLTNSAITDNVSTANGRDGIHVRRGSTGNDVGKNRAVANRRDGVRLDENASRNTIEHNRASGNSKVDCYDNTTGSGSGANFWVSDKGDTQNRPGLCHGTPRLVAHGVQ